MFYRLLIFCFLGLTPSAAASVWAQSQPEPRQAKDLVYGRPYKVPAVKVYLTDQETGEPFAERDIKFRYCWGWEVVKENPETERMARTLCKDASGRTDKEGTTVLPEMSITPSRPIAPPGAEFSEPRFMYAGILVRDEKHDAYLSVYDAKVNLLDAKGEVRRAVPLARR